MNKEDEHARYVAHLTQSDLWPEPSRRFSRYLDMVEDTGLPKILAVLGCSDGTYAVPAARRGFRVLAIDIDEVALYGGVAVLATENKIVLGLAKRLEVEKLKDLVQIVHANFVEYPHGPDYSGVFTSGSIQYEDNIGYSSQELISAIQSYVMPGGLLLLEYVHTSQADNSPERHIMTGSKMATFFSGKDWTIASNKKKTYTEKLNPRNPTTHSITWGRLYAHKNSG